VSQHHSVAVSAHHRCVIIGAGFGGIGASIKLAEHGIEHVILEKLDDVGGTWLSNQYPGCRCDVPSHLYSFSFALNPDWSDSYSLQPEIWRYLKNVAVDNHVVERVRFGCKVDAARWDGEQKRWQLDTSDGPISCDVLIAAHGFLSEPSIPHFEGIETFAGQVMHSAQWDPSYDVAGKRVGVIGTGASAVQIVPEVAKTAAHLTVFQRTAAWSLPHRGRPIHAWERALYRRVPRAQRVVRGFHYWSSEFLAVPALMNPERGRLLKKMARGHLEKQVPDPELRAQLTPSFTPGCKRLTPSNEYLPAIASSATTLVTSGIDHVEKNGIVTKDGALHELDVIILATGFRVTDNTFPELIIGRDGRTMRETWDITGNGGYNGTTFAGFPNLFMLAGPNTGIGHTSLVYMIEAQFPYILDALRLMDERGIVELDVRPDVQVRFNEMLQRKLALTVWNTGGCKSWYLDKNGHNSTIWPDYTFKFARRLRRFDLESYYQEIGTDRPAALAGIS
jgi:cation diffusion facilitator CzcD-associated flavoprotein CzcO